jgi:prepilin signal peptidase PulO-like enzyme (type II secretory pathway)
MYAGLMGLLIGSAINALVWRLYVGRSWVHGRSMCPDCKHELHAKDLIPVVSWLWLRGKCRYCGQRIHWQYPVVELMTAALFALSAYQLAPAGVVDGLRLALWLVILTMLIILAVYDLRWMILPNKVVFPTIVLSLLYAAVAAASSGSAAAWTGPLLAAGAAFAGFWALNFFSGGRAMGGGDVKLVLAMGLLLGLKGTALAMLIAFNVGALAGIALIAARRRGRRDQIPFGPFLVLGTIVVFLYGHNIIAWYLRANGLA